MRLIGFVAAMAMMVSANSSYVPNGQFADFNHETGKTMAIQPMWSNANPSRCVRYADIGYPTKHGGIIKWKGGVKYICYPCIPVGTTWACTFANEPIRELS